MKKKILIVTAILLVLMSSLLGLLLYKYFNSQKQPVEKTGKIAISLVYGFTQTVNLNLEFQGKMVEKTPEAIVLEDDSGKSQEIVISQNATFKDANNKEIQLEEIEIGEWLQVVLTLTINPKELEIPNSADETVTSEQKNADEPALIPSSPYLDSLLENFRKPQNFISASLITIKNENDKSLSLIDLSKNEKEALFNDLKLSIVDNNLGIELPYNCLNKGQVDLRLKGKIDQFDGNFYYLVAYSEKNNIFQLELDKSQTKIFKGLGTDTQSGTFEDLIKGKDFIAYYTQPIDFSGGTQFNNFYESKVNTLYVF